MTTPAPQTHVSRVLLGQVFAEYEFTVTLNASADPASALANLTPTCKRLVLISQQNGAEVTVWEQPPPPPPPAPPAAPPAAPSAPPPTGP